MSPLDDDSARWLINIAIIVATATAFGTSAALIWAVVKHCLWR